MSKSNNRNLIVYLLIILAVLLLVFTMTNRWRDNENYSYAQFEQDLNEGNKIASIELHPYSETPTGAVQVTLKTGVTKTLYVSDITEVENELKTEFPLYTSAEVSRENWFFAYALPILLAFAVVFVVIALMNTQSNNSGGGKMMNFGKSRAIKTMAGDIKVTFGDVAGLEEEKENHQGYEWRRISQFCC